MSSQSLTITFAHRNPNNFRRFRFETEYASAATTSSASSSSSSTATPFAIVRIFEEPRFEEPRVIETIDLTDDNEDEHQDLNQDLNQHLNQDLDQDDASSEFSEEDPFDFNNPEPQKDSEVVVINGDSVHNDTDTQHAPVQEEDMDFEEEDIEIREERIDIQEEDFDMDEEEELLEQGIRERANESDIEREIERQREREALMQDLHVTQPSRRSGRTLRIFQRFIDDPIFMQRMRNNRCQNVHYVTCKKYSSKGLTIPMSERCGICIRPVSRGDAFVTSCNHLYCSQCFDQWNKHCFNYSARKLMTCPMCRSTTFTVTKFVAKKSK